MPNRVPKSYEEITRATVPNPDSSYRPSFEQERQAYEGFRAMDEDEQALFDRIDVALMTSGLDREHVQVEVERDNVTVRGSVPDEETLTKLIDTIREVEGVGYVDDRLVIAAH